MPTELQTPVAIRTGHRPSTREVAEAKAHLLQEPPVFCGHGVRFHQCDPCMKLWNSGVYACADPQAWSMTQTSPSGHASDRAPRKHRCRLHLRDLRAGGAPD